MSRISIDFETATLKIMMSRYFRGRTRFKMAVRYVISQVYDSIYFFSNKISYLIIDESTPRTRC